MNTTRAVVTAGFGRRQTVAAAILAVGLLVVLAMNWLPDLFPDALAAPHPGYWITLFGGFAVAMTGVVLSLRESLRWRRERRRTLP